MNSDISCLARRHQSLIHHCVKHLETEYDYWYGTQFSELSQQIRPLVERILGEFILCDNAYHDLEHTVQVVLVGQEILNGCLRCGEAIAPRTWLNFIVALLCHDLGYLKGICPNDDLEQWRFSPGPRTGLVTLPETATGASLTPYHVDRSRQFVGEVLLDEFPWLDGRWIGYAIEQTRFPVIPEVFKRNADPLAALVRAADLIGQLADPSYLAKLPALFKEFEETGTHQALGYQAPEDLRAAFPSFYWKSVSIYVMQGIRYLEVSQSGQAILANLYGNRQEVEKELDRFYAAQRRPACKIKRWLQGWQASLQQRAGVDMFI